MRWSSNTRENFLIEFNGFFYILTKLKSHIYSDWMIGIVEHIDSGSYQCAQPLLSSNTRENYLIEFNIFFYILTKLKPHIYSDWMIGVFERIDRSG